MSVQVKRRREAAGFLSSFVGAAAELIVDTTNNRIQTHDGVTPGGWPAAKLSETQTIGRTHVADADYQVLPDDVAICMSALTATRTVGLPAAAAFPAGRMLRVTDEAGSASSSVQIIVAARPGESVDGVASAAISLAYGSMTLASDGAGKWIRLRDAPSVLGNLVALGVGAAADPGNPVTATLNSVLFNALAANSGGAGDIRVKLNKQATGNTASFLFQDNWSGRAEIGLCGDDSFHFKTSVDGSVWRDALVLTAAGVMRPAVFPLADLPPGLVGAQAFVSNGRKQSEGAGAGTGVLAVFSNGAWRRVSDDSPVLA